MLARLSLIGYRLLWLLLLPLLLLVLVIRSRNHPEYRQRLSERLGLNGRQLKETDIVLHAASVGEVLALRPLVQALQENHPEKSITFTCFTPTGSAQIQKLFGDTVQHCYLPLDTWPCTSSFLKAVKPKLFIFMETEIWPNLLHQCKHRGIHSFIINGRLSNKSLPKYKKLKQLITPSLNLLADIYCQSKINQDNFRSLGVSPEKCVNVGNLKFDIKINQQLIQKQQELAPLIDPQRPLLVLASSHEGDEQRLLQYHRQLKLAHPNLLIAIVPRHPERFNTVAQLCEKQQLRVVRRSENTLPKADDDVWLVDTLGELLAVSSFATLVVMGGSFTNIGGHNPLEPALFKKPVIVGPDMSNFVEVMQQLQQANGIVQISEQNDDLFEQVDSVLGDQALKDRIGENALSVVQNNQGATEKTIKRIIDLLS